MITCSYIRNIRGRGKEQEDNNKHNGNTEMMEIEEKKKISKGSRTLDQILKSV